MIGKGELNVDIITKEMQRSLTSEMISIEYIHITNKNFKSIKTVKIGNTIVLVAVKIGTTRLIDNIWI